MIIVDSRLYRSWTWRTHIASWSSVGGKRFYMWNQAICMYYICKSNHMSNLYCKKSYQLIKGRHFIYRNGLARLHTQATQPSSPSISFLFKHRVTTAAFWRPIILSIYDPLWIGADLKLGFLKGNTKWWKTEESKQTSNSPTRML